jgi:hypothetical protein
LGSTHTAYFQATQIRLPADPLALLFYFIFVNNWLFLGTDSVHYARARAHLYDIVSVALSPGLLRYYHCAVGNFSNPTFRKKMWHLRFQGLVGPRIIMREHPIMLNNKLHGATPQKISSIYINAARTPNPANVDLQTVFHAQYACL